jgi:hypothetical protein
MALVTALGSLCPREHLLGHLYSPVRHAARGVHRFHPWASGGKHLLLLLLFLHALASTLLAPVSSCPLLSSLRTPRAVHGRVAG